MNTPKTDQFTYRNDYALLLASHRQLETQVQELREALEKVLPKVAHEYKCGKVRPSMHWAEHGSMSFDDCQCVIKTVRAILEKTS